MFAALRGLCDVVVVAGGTVRTEGYEGIEVPAQWCGVRSRLGLPEHIQLVVVSGSGRLPEAVLSPGVGVPLLWRQRWSAQGGLLVALTSGN